MKVMGKERSNKKCQAKRTCTWPSIGDAAQLDIRCVWQWGGKLGQGQLVKLQAYVGGLSPPYIFCGIQEPQEAFKRGHDLIYSLERSL